MQTEAMPRYNEYQFTIMEKLLYGLAFFAAGGMVGFIFYGNLFMKDGELTLLSYISNLVVFSVIGVVGMFLFFPICRRKMIEKRKKQLRLEFREMLSSLSTAFTSGENVDSAFASAERDMTAQFGSQSDIVRELRAINAGISNNVRKDILLMDFGQRSGLEDIEDFANVFQVCLSKGANINSVVRHSYNLIGDKLAINEEIQTKITSNQMQQNIMSVVPIVMIGFLRFSSSSFAESFASLKGVVTITVAAIIFIVSYRYGNKIVDIKG